ncbi:carboxylate--amine ligase [Desulfopila inferna]|uniref:carboxylate--amine ligase n=1 Tax=Desulfopila inferna TaxID=468528 RepID=UPI0019633C3C|nr:ATP-grasp domain-containing protein [Desulfopila inferna]MBM9605717.1 ATP-grasp domain-containing protein [Desulfopila inferna]
MKILVTDGNSRAALAITRSLGKKNHHIVVGEHKHPSLASSSKYCRECITYPDPTRQPQEFIDRIKDIIKEMKIEVILPVTDVTTIPVCEHKKDLEPYCHVPFSNPESVNFAADKSKLFHLAEELGVAVPKSFWLEEEGDKDKIGDKLSYPLVIKPGRSRIKTENGWLSTMVKYADNQRELNSILAAESPLAYPLLLQERIIGPGVGIFVCYNHGTPLAFFSHRRLREKPPSGGVSVLRESIPVSPVAREFSERLLNHLQWHGVAMVEFKVDQRDDTPKLMEINGRFWGSLQLAIDAGVDFPALLIDIIDQKTSQSLVKYTAGVRTRWLLGDVDSLLMILFKRRSKLKLPKGHRSRIQYLLEFLKLWQKNTNYEVLKWDDMRPWFYEFSQWHHQNKK